MKAYQTGWQSEYQSELGRARAARSEGNEGMARVCARRAAGVLVRVYFADRGIPLAGTSVLNHLRILQGSTNEPAAVREVARHFSLRITPDHLLPEDVDLIADVEWLARTLFPGGSAG